MSIFGREVGRTRKGGRDPCVFFVRWRDERWERKVDREGVVVGNDFDQACGAREQVDGWYSGSVDVWRRGRSSRSRASPGGFVT